MNSLIPELLVDDLVTTIEWYRSILGFKSITTVPDSTSPTFARLKKEKVELMFYHRSEFKREIPSFASARVGGSFVLYLEVEDIETTWDNVKDKAEVVQSLHQTDYGTQEFTILDCNGYHLMFGGKST